MTASWKRMQARIEPEPPSDPTGRCCGTCQKWGAVAGPRDDDRWRLCSADDLYANHDFLCGSYARIPGSSVPGWKLTGESR